MVLLNVGIPFFQTDPRAIAMLLVPVIAVEAIVVRRLTRIPWGKVVITGVVANAYTTLAGYPIGWVFMRGIRALAGHKYYGGSWFQFPWDELVNSAFYDTWLSQSMGSLAIWAVYAGALLLLVLTFLFSVWIETLACASMLKRPVAELRVAIRKANLLSYGLLAVLMIWLGVANAIQVTGWQTDHKPFGESEPVMLESH
ncbi:MAG: hypothetical protein HY812_06820 [Planctomycetes bacterium]|nr:hypothetical protein [Planctomycetota bacterium]